MQTYMSIFRTHLEDERQVSPHTVRNYLSDLRQFLQVVEEDRGEGAGPLIQPNQIEAGMIRTYLKVLYQRGAEARTLGRKLASLRSFLQFMERRGYVDNNAARAVRTPKATRPLPNTLPIDHVFALLDTPEEREFGGVASWMGKRDQAILEIFYASGIRVSELAALDVRNIDLAEGLMRVLGKGNRERQVYFGKTASRALQHYLEARGTYSIGEGEAALFLTAVARVFQRAPVRTLYGTRSPRIFWITAQTCAASRNCSDTSSSLPRRNTPMSVWTACWTCMTARTHVPGGPRGTHDPQYHHSLRASEWAGGNGRRRAGEPQHDRDEA